MRHLLKIGLACLALAVAATPAAAAQPTFVEIIEALRQNDVATLQAALNDQAMIDDLAAVDPESAVVLLLDLADGLAKAGRADLARGAATKAVRLAERTWGPDSLEIIEPLRRRAALLLERDPWTSVSDLERARTIVGKVAGDNADAYADLDTALRAARSRKAQRERLAAREERGDVPAAAAAPPPPPPPPAAAEAAPPPPPPPPAAAEAPPPTSSAEPPVVEPEPVFDLVTIFYATERARTGQRGAVRFYGGRRGPLEYGQATISVPRNREVGTLDVPDIWTLDLRVDPARHFILTRVDPMRGDAAFFRAVSDRVAGSGRKEVFVFVHGFNTTFEGAALRTAQMASDLRLDGAPILWSWPSRGAVLGYWNDAREAESEVEAAALETFLRDVVARTGATRIHLVAHSMGARPLLAALKRIGRPPEGAPPPFDEIVLAAPDVGIGPFDEVWPAVNGLGRRFTLYSSARDKALALSRWVNGMPRVGDASPVIVRPGLQTVDTTRASGGLLGHSDFAGTALDDFRAVIWLSLAPSRRCVLTAEVEQQTWWSFGGPCPADEFRLASEAVRQAGGVAPALAQVDAQLATAPLDQRHTLETLKNRLLDIGAR